MAPNNDDDVVQVGRRKQLTLFSKPIESDPNSDDASKPNKRPTISEAVSNIKTDDFVNVTNTPCARNGFMTGIIGAGGVGGVKFLLSGSVLKSAHWAVGVFVVGSTLSYEYCQYQRRAERTMMKRTIEIVNDKRRADIKEKETQQKLEEERKAAQRGWYKFW